MVYPLMMSYKYARNMWRLMDENTEDKQCNKLVLFI